MPVNSTHDEYAGALMAWVRARDVLAGEDAIKAAGQRYLPRLDSQTDEEFAVYVQRASFFNATARTAEGYCGLIFRRPPFVKLPEAAAAPGRALAAFANNADMLGSTLSAYAKNVMGEVIAMGRAGTLVDWEGDVENRVYVSLYTAENILNWRVERMNGRNIPTMVVLFEGAAEAVAGREGDPFVTGTRQQIRVLRLVESSQLASDERPPSPRPSRPGEGETHSAFGGFGSRKEYACVVEIWQKVEGGRRGCRCGWASRCRRCRSCFMGRVMRCRKSASCRWRT